MVAVNTLPVQFERNYKGAPFIGTLFTTTASLNSWLTSPTRYAGQGATLVEAGVVTQYVLNAAENAWTAAGGGAGGITVWVTATVYAIGDQIYNSITNKLYRCITGHTASAAFNTDVAKWSELSSGGFLKWITATAYIVDDQVYDPTSNKLYIATGAHTASAAFITDIANWKVVNPQVRFSKWTTATDYLIDDFIWEPTSNKIYVATADHTSSAAFVTDIANWTEQSASTFEGVYFDSSNEINGPVTHADNLHKVYSHISSAGIFDGGAITDNLDGTVSIASCSASIRDSATVHSNMLHINLAASGVLALTDATANYLYIDYNVGVPQWVVSTSSTSYNGQDKIVAFLIARRGNLLKIVDAREASLDFARKADAMFKDLVGYGHKTGGSLLGSTGLNVTVTAGKFFWGVSDIPHDAFDTSIAGTAPANVFVSIYGAYTIADDVKLLDNVNYDNAGTLTALGVGKFKVDWLYIVNDSPSTLALIYGDAQYNNLAAAELAIEPPSLPPALSGVGVLIGRYIIQEGVGTVIAQSAFERTFASASVTNHNDLSTLQGGVVDEYYHLTAEQHAIVNAAKNVVTINYLDGDNNNANSIGDWITYVDAAGTIPVDGTGGIANVTFLPNAVTPLRGSADFNFVKDAVNRQGEGASCIFTIDNADKTQKPVISFDYDTSDVNYIDGDLKVFIYDITNLKLIRVNGEDLKGGKGVHYAQFQTAPDSVSYRLIVHQSSTNATAYSLNFDNLIVGPTGNVGINQEIVVEGAGNGNTVLTADVTDIDFIELRDTTSSWNGSQFLCPETGEYSITGMMFTSTTHAGGVQAYIDGSANTFIGTNPIATAATLISGNIELEKGQILSFRTNTAISLSNNPTVHHIHIQKVGTSAEAASVNGGRDVFMKANEGTATITATHSDVAWTTTEEDTTASFDGTTYTIPESGKYKIASQLWISMTSSGVNSTTNIQILKNGSALKEAFKRLATTSGDTVNVETEESFLKGDLIKIQVSSSGTTPVISASTVRNTFTVSNKASSNSSLETATVAARYNDISGTPVLNATPTKIPFDTKVYDSHSAMSLGTYTVQVSGFYSGLCKITLAGCTAGVGNLSMSLKHKPVGGSLTDISNSNTGFSTSTQSLSFPFGGYFEKGDELEGSVYQSNGATRNMYTTNDNYIEFSIARIK